LQAQATSTVAYTWRQLLLIRHHDVTGTSCVGYARQAID